MGFEATLNWTASGLLAAVFVYRLSIVRTRKFQDKMVTAFWQRVVLPFGTEEVRLSLRKHLHRGATAAVLGGLAGGLLALALYQLTNQSGLPFNFTWLVALPAIFVGVTAFDVAWTLRDSLLSFQPGTPRMARLEAVDLRDYLSPFRLRMAPVLLALAAALNVAAFALGIAGVVDLGGFLRGPGLPLLGAAAVVLGFCAVMARKVLEQPQPAADSLELAWDDAIRADIFRKLALLSSVMSWLAVSATALGTLGLLGTGPDASMGLALGQMLSAWGYFAVLYMFIYGKSFSWFRFRLWPDFSLHGSTPGQSQSQSQSQP